VRTLRRALRRRSSETQSPSHRLKQRGAVWSASGVGHCARPARILARCSSAITGVVVPARTIQDLAGRHNLTTTPPYILFSAAAARSTDSRKILPIKPHCHGSQECQRCNGTLLVWLAGGNARDGSTNHCRDDTQHAGVHINRHHRVVRQEEELSPIASPERLPSAVRADLPASGVFWITLDDHLELPRFRGSVRNQPTVWRNVGLLLKSGPANRAPRDADRSPG